MLLRGLHCCFQNVGMKMNINKYIFYALQKSYFCAQDLQLVVIS